MKIIIVGSLALNECLKYPNSLEGVIPTDTDLIVSNAYTSDIVINQIKNDLNAFQTFEELESSYSAKFGTVTRYIKVNGFVTEITYPVEKFCSTALLLDYVDEINCPMSKDIAGLGAYVANIDILYTLKMSHRYLKDSKHFCKTFYHIKNIRRVFKDVKIFDDAWYKLRQKETYDYSHPNLNVSKNEFFNSNFDYIYDHDSIHEAVKMMPEPAYKYYSNGEVSCSKELFESLPEAIRMMGVYEEACVLALERSQIPTDFGVDPKISYAIALEKVCTSITSGWFREFAWENFDVLMMLYNPNYVQSFKDGILNGTVKAYKGN